MTAIPLVDPAHAPLLARPYLPEEGCSPLAAALAHVPEILESAMPFIGKLYGPTALPDRLKEIVVVRISALNGCRYCTRVHGALAVVAGLLPSEIAALGGGEVPTPTVDETESARPCGETDGSPTFGEAEVAATAVETEHAPTSVGTERAPTFAEEERAAITFAEALCRRPADSVALLRPHFRDDQIVELALLGATTISLNRFCTAMGLS